MQIKQKGFSKALGIFFVFILSIIPLLYLSFYFKNLAERQSSINEELVKERLLNAINKFRDDLKPESYIEKALKDLEEYFKFPDLDNNNYKFSFGEGCEPDYITTDFIKKSNQFLMEKYGIKPFLFISCGYDFKDIVVDDPNHIFKDEIYKNNFVNAFLGRNYNYFTYKPIVKPIIESNRQYVNDKINIIEKLYTLDDGSRTNAYMYECAKSISLFNLDLSDPRTCYGSFSTNNINQNIYQYYCPLLLKESNNVIKILGTYLIMVKSSDISISKFLESITRNSLDKENLLTTRNILKESIKAPAWETDENTITYKIPFPSYFSNYLESHKKFNPEEYLKYKNFINNNAISVSIAKSELTNNFQEYQKYCNIIICIIIALLCVILLNSIFSFISPRVLLPLKVRAIVLMAVIIPVTGLWCIYILVSEKEQTLLINSIENTMAERLALLSKYKNDILTDANINLLEFKQFISQKYYENSSDYFWGSLKNDRLIPGQKKSEIIAKIYLLDKSGNLADLGKTKNTFSVKFSSIINMYKIMSDMRLLDESTLQNIKNNEQYILLSSYTDSYTKAYNNQNILARESHIIPSENIALSNKVSYMLVSDKNSPNNPDFIVLSTVAIYEIGKVLWAKIINPNLSLLSQQIGNARIEYGIFNRTEANFVEITPLKAPYPYYPLLKGAAQKALNKKSSDTEISYTPDSIIIKKWNYIRDSALLLTAAAIIPNKDLTFFSSKLFALLLVIYAILAIALLSDLLVGALLAPINALTKFVTEISNGHFNVNTKIETGDEMEELSDSFNKMSEGLCEREKLRRFVSDKLYNSLATNNNNTITSADVTILSSDIRSFTTISEKNEPEVVVSLLNDYFTLMEKAITKYGGSIEKIIGDAISAAFYGEKSPEHALNACKAALEMRESLKQFNEERSKQGLFTIENGIGLATGSVMIGFAGQKARRREFLLMGPILKEAEALEAKTKSAVSSKIFIDKNTYDKISDKLKVCEPSENQEVFCRELSIEQ